MRPLSATAWAWLAKVGRGSIAMRPPKTPGEWQRARWHLPHFGGDMGGSGQCGLGIGANWLQHAPMGRFLPLAAVALLLPLSGCCSLSRLFCGPDKSPWVPIDYSTPEATVRVLLEAIRRDEPSVVYESLAQEYCSRMKLDGVTAALAWQRLRDEVPGLHVVGYAEVPPPVRIADHGATFELAVEGRKLRIDVVRESTLTLTYWNPVLKQTQRIARQVVSWNTLASITGLDHADQDLSKFELKPVQFEHEGLPEVPLEHVQNVALQRSWKVSGITMLQP